MSPIEDIKQGLSGIANNLPSLVVGMKANPDVIAALALAAVAIDQLVRHWDEVVSPDRLP